MPSITGENLVKALKKLGYKKVRQRGSHVTLVRQSTGSVIVVPIHKGKDLPPGTLHAILSAAGITLDDVRDLLR